MSIFQRRDRFAAKFKPIPRRVRLRCEAELRALKMARLARMSECIILSDSESESENGADGEDENEEEDGRPNSYEDEGEGYANEGERDEDEEEGDDYEGEGNAEDQQFNNHSISRREGKI